MASNMTSTNIKTEPASFVGSHQICRLCLSDGSLEDIFTVEGLHQWISECLWIMVSPEDRMSRSICASCRIRLIEFRQFRISCQNVQSILQSSLQIEDVQTRTGSYESVHIPSSDVIAEDEQPPEVENMIVIEEVKIESRSDDEVKIPSILIDKDAVTWCEFDANKAIVESIHHQSKSNETPLQSDSNVDLEGEESGMAEEIDSDCSPFVSTTDQPVQTNKENNHLQQFQCSICQRVYPTRRKMVRHMRYHTSKNFACDICGKQFMFRYLMYAHMATHEPNSETFECDICQKTFKLKQLVWNHKSKVHGSKRYDCNVCGVQFKIRHQLKRHLKSHARTHINADESYNQ